MNKHLVVYQNSDVYVPEGIVKLEWYDTKPPKSLPLSLRILICPYVSDLPRLPAGLLYLEISRDVKRQFTPPHGHRCVPPQCHIEDACGDYEVPMPSFRDIVSLCPYKFIDLFNRMTMCLR